MITGRSFPLGGHLETKICDGEANPALRKTAVTGGVTLNQFVSF